MFLDDFDADDDAELPMIDAWLLMSIIFLQQILSVQVGVQFYSTPLRHYANP